MNKSSAIFKAPQHPQLRVGHRPCKGPRVDTKILKKVWTYSELSNHVSGVRLYQNAQFWARKLKNLTCVAHQKLWVSTRGRKKDLASGAHSR